MYKGKGEVAPYLIKHRIIKTHWEWRYSSANC